MLGQEVGVARQRLQPRLPSLPAGRAVADAPRNTIIRSSVTRLSLHVRDELALPADARAARAW